MCPTHPEILHLCPRMLITPHCASCGISSQTQPSQPWVSVWMWWLTCWRKLAGVESIKDGDHVVGEGWVFGRTAIIDFWWSPIKSSGVSKEPTGVAWFLASLGQADIHSDNISIFFLYQAQKLASRLVQPDFATMIHAMVTPRLDYCNALYAGHPCKYFGNFRQSRMHMPGIWLAQIGIPLYNQSWVSCIQGADYNF